MVDGGVWSDGAMILTVADGGVWSDGAMILTVADRCNRPQIAYGMASDRTRTRNDRQAPDRFWRDKASRSRDGHGKILAYHVTSFILSPF